VSLAEIHGRFVVLPSANQNHPEREPHFEPPPPAAIPSLTSPLLQHHSTIYNVLISYQAQANVQEISDTGLNVLRSSQDPYTWRYTMIQGIFFARFLPEQGMFVLYFEVPQLSEAELKSEFILKITA
jgi:hypothetical protein